jgi:hypothetical protein
MNDMHFSSPMWPDPKTTAAVTSGHGDHGPSVAQTDDLALGDYTYFLDEVNHHDKLVVSTYGRRWRGCARSADDRQGVW